MGFPYITLPVTIGGSSAAYSANQVIGTGIQTLTPVPGNGFVQSVNITAKSTVSAQIDMMLFKSSMANTTFTDHSSIAISSNDCADCGPVINVTNWAYGGTACTVGSANGLAYAYAAGGGGRQHLFFALVARAALTVNSTSDFTVSVTIVS